MPQLHGSSSVWRGDKHLANCVHRLRREWAPPSATTRYTGTITMVDLAPRLLTAGSEYLLILGDGTRLTCTIQYRSGELYTYNVACWPL